MEIMYFQRRLFQDQNSIEAEFYDRTVKSIFEEDEADSGIEARCWSRLALDEYRKQTSPAQVYSGANSKVISHVGRTPGQAESSSTDIGLFPQANKPAIVNDAVHSAAPRDHVRLPHMSLQPSLLAVIDLDLNKLGRFVQYTEGQLRTFLIRRTNSCSRLQIRETHFENLLKELRIAPQIKNFLIELRWRPSDTEIGPPRMKSYQRFEIAQDGIVHQRGFDCTYMVRYVEFTNRPGRPPWSLRLFAVHHKSHEGPPYCSSWVLIGAWRRIEECFDQYAQNTTDLPKRSPLELHAIYLNIAIASWRPYLIYLQQQLTDLSDKALYTETDGKDEVCAPYRVKVDDYQALKEIEDLISDTILCLDSTLDTVNGLSRLGSGLSYDVVSFALDEQRRDIEYSRKKAEALLTKAQNTRALISSLLEKMTGHSLDQQILALHDLQRQGYEENAIMRQLAEKSSRDSTSVRILTIITLIYLPFTVVASFYSTDFISHVETSSGYYSITYAKNTWMFFAVSVPLTFFTLVVWYTWANSHRLYRIVVASQEVQEERLRGFTKAFTSLRKVPKLPC